MRSHVAVNPRFGWWGFPIKLLNYMETARAIVSCRGSAHGLCHLKNAWISDNGDLEHFAQGIIELDEQAHAYAKGKPIIPKIYSKQIFSNAIPLIGNMTDNGYTDEEMKLTKEGAKILGMDSLKASITCVRVPVMRSHSVTMTAQFERPVSDAAARAAIDAFNGVQVMDDPHNGVFPSPLDVTNGDDCMVGRIRSSLVLENALDLWVVGDQVRKGAALNAVQIAELLV